MNQSFRSLCESCQHRRVVISGKGSRFLRCDLATTNASLPKYPPQPVGQCSAYVVDDPTEPGLTDE